MQKKLTSVIAQFTQTANPAKCALMQSIVQELFRIVYGAKIAVAKHFGFNELKITNHLLKELGLNNVEIMPDFMKKECVEVFEYWALKKDKKVY